MKLASLLDTSKEYGIRPMTSDESFAFMQLTAMEMENPNWQMSEDDANNPWVVLIWDRLAKAECPVTQQLVFFVASLCSQPEHAITWAYTICHMLEKTSNTPTLDMMTMRFFPKGPPSEDAYQACWQAQKTADGEHNLMDRIYNWWGEAPEQ